GGYAALPSHKKPVEATGRQWVGPRQTTPRPRTATLQNPQNPESNAAASARIQAACWIVPIAGSDAQGDPEKNAPAHTPGFLETRKKRRSCPASTAGAPLPALAPTGAGDGRPSDA